MAVQRIVYPKAAGSNLVISAFFKEYGNISIGRMRALGARGCQFESGFPYYGR